MLIFSLDSEKDFLIYILERKIMWANREDSKNAKTEEEQSHKSRKSMLGNVFQLNLRCP